MNDDLNFVKNAKGWDINMVSLSRRKYGSQRHKL